MKKEFIRMKKNCQEESTQKTRKVRAELYQRESEEERLMEEREDLMRRKDNIKKTTKAFEGRSTFKECKWF